MKRSVYFLSWLLLLPLFVSCNASQEKVPADVTSVYRSEQSPTGYYATFCFPDAGYKEVKIQGEWVFSDLGDASVKTSTNAGPLEWKNGYVQWNTVRQPYYDMELDGDVWRITFPLPSGWYKYKFFADGKECWDPANPPKNRDLNATDLSGEDRFSAVYVPYDPVRQSLSSDRSIEAPTAAHKGSYHYVELPASGSDDLLRFGVYLPYGFDAKRAEPYPVLVLFHGGGGTEASWINNGLASIMDNLNEQGLTAEPTVILTPNGSRFFRGRREELDQAVINDILPYAVEHYNITKDPAKRAFAGLSMGGATTMFTLLNHPDAFQYYFAMSAPTTLDIDLDLFANPVLKQKNICLAVGMYDFVKVECLLNPNSSQARGGERSFYAYEFAMFENGVPFKTLPEYQNGHDWVLWRRHIADYFKQYLWR